MKKLLAITLTLASFGLLGLGTAEAKSNAVTSASPQVRIQIGQQRRRRGVYNRGLRSVRQTRIVRVGRHTFRETYLVRHLPNGRTNTTLISRERIS